MEEFVTCQICGEHKKVLGNHVRIHGITIQEYKHKYPNAPTITEKTRQKFVVSFKKWWHKLTPEQQAEQGRKIQKGRQRNRFFYVRPFWDKPKQQKKLEEHEPRKKRHLIRQKLVPFTPAERELRNKLLSEMIVV